MKHTDSRHSLIDRMLVVSPARPVACVRQVRAPVKGFYTLDHSAHSPIYEEPEKVRRILSEDVLSGTNKLADPA